MATPDKDSTLNTKHTTDFWAGEQPTETKLNANFDGVGVSDAEIKEFIGDIKADTNLLNSYSTTFAADFGDKAKLNPIIPPNFSISEFKQTLKAGQTEHELDMIPITPANVTINFNEITQVSSESCIVINQRKTIESDLKNPGDWYLKPALLEAGKQKTSRKLVTYSPSTGGIVTFREMTTGNGGAYTDATYNTIPELATTEVTGAANALFLLLSEQTPNAADPSAVIYLAKLPNRSGTGQKQYSRTGDIIDTNISNTASSVYGTQLVSHRFELPKFWFATQGMKGLGIGISQSIPDNYIDIYEVISGSKPKRVKVIFNVTSASAQNVLLYEFTFQCTERISLLSSNKYFLVIPGTLLYPMVGNLATTLVNHTHDGDDMLRSISHRSLLGLRTTNYYGIGDLANLSDRKKYYGVSNINNNDHSMYFHRDGFISSDLGGGGNVIRGDLVVGSILTGANSNPSTYLPTYNTEDNSNYLVFGKHTGVGGGASLRYKKKQTITSTVASGQVPATITEPNVLEIIGPEVTVTPPSGSSYISKMVYVEDFLKVKGHASLGTTKDDDVIVSGDISIGYSAIFTPRTSADFTSPVEGQLYYDSTKKGLLFYNGTSFTTSEKGYGATVGYPGVSQGSYNGTDSTTIQNAINYVSGLGGGNVLLQKGTYTCANSATTPSGTITIPSNVRLIGIGAEAVVVGPNSTSAISLPASTTKATVENFTINGSSATTGIYLAGTNSNIKGMFINSCSIGIRLETTAQENWLDSTIRFSSCTSDIVAQNTYSTNRYKNGAVRFNNGYTPILNPVNKKEDTYKWEFISGTGTVAYSNVTSLSGYGRWEFTLGATSCVLYLNEFIPMSPNIGQAGVLEIAKISAGSGGAEMTVKAGVACFDGGLAIVGGTNTRRPFLVNGTTLATGIWTTFKNLIFGIDNAAVANKYFTGTSFIKPYIEIMGNSGDKFVVDDFIIQRAMGAWGALYY